jgi:tRNA(fMet)-specific endonuclease VapC
VIILDTTHLSKLLYSDSTEARTIEERLSVLPRSETWITVVSPYEQFKAVLGLINSASSAGAQVTHFGLFMRLLEFYSSKWAGRILPFDDDAAKVFLGFPPKLIRQIGPRDAKIAAIALARNATLVTANLSDFRLVPGLDARDWLRPETDLRTPDPPTTTH